MRAGIFAIVCAAILAGCGVETIQSTTELMPLRGSQRASLVNSAREVVVVGTPPDASTPEALAALLRIPGERNDRAFTVVPAPGRGYRLVAAYGAPRGRPCQQPSGTAIDLPLELTVTYCVDGRRLSEATMRSQTIRGPSDPDFAGALDRLMMSLTRLDRSNNLRLD